MSALRVALIGAAGRMGQAIERATEANPDVEIVARVNRGDRIEDSLGDSAVAIDFSPAAATKGNTAACVAQRIPLVIGATGHTEAQRCAIEAAANLIPILLSANFSVGVNTLFWLAREAVGLLGNDFAVEISETHHRQKKDAPSGTAKRLAEVIEEAQLAPRRAVKTESIRTGEVIGEHTVVFASQGERLELTHRALSRDIFALGALRAARWIVGRPAQLYSMEDVVALKPE